MSNRISEYDRSELSLRGTRFINRLYNMVSVPPELGRTEKEVYYNLLPKDLRELVEHGDALHGKYKQLYNTDLLFDIDSVSVNAAVHVTAAEATKVDTVRAGRYRVSIRIRLNEPAMMFGYFPTVDESNPHYPAVNKWVRQYVYVNSIAERARVLFWEILQNCRTVGQWKTVFPQIIVLMPSDQQARIREYKREVPWPKHLRQDIQKEISFLTNVFARCAALPEKRSGLNITMEYQSFTAEGSL